MFKFLIISHNHWFWKNDVGDAEEATAVFGEAAALCIQKQFISHASAFQNFNTCNEDHTVVSARSVSSEDISPRQQKNVQVNNVRDIPGNYNGGAALGVAASQPSNGGPSNLSFCNTPSPMSSQVLYSG